MSWLRDAAVIDFEALPIRNRPTYPPAPVGVALDVPGRRARYLAWGHPTGRNNSTWEEARREVGDLQASGRPLLYHNAKFDVEVQTTHLDLPLPPWEQVHDTLPMLFLQDPRAPDYQLKPSAERLLGEAPEERDEMIDWLVEHQPVPGVKLVPTRTKSRSNKAKTNTYAGAYVAFAPPSVAGPYAIGDVRRTKALARHVYPYLEKMGMVGAYNLERALLPTLLAMEKRGVRVDLKRLGKDIDLYQRALVKLAAWIRQRLGVKEDFNLNSPKLGEALVKAQVADPAKLGRNSKGYEVNKDALERGVIDSQMLAALRYYGSMTSYLSNPMTPWYEQASVTGGLIYTMWHSTRRSHDEGGLAGARTGRLSCTPNLMNLRKKVEQHFRSRRNKSLPLAPVKLPPLPVIRQYIIPYDEGEVLFGRDFSSQEWRMFAHFEDGPLCQRFNEEPETDLHQEVCNAIVSYGFKMVRGDAKHLNFGLLYGMGQDLLAKKLKTDRRGVRVAGGVLQVVTVGKGSHAGDLAALQGGWVHSDMGRTGVLRRATKVDQRSLAGLCLQGAEHPDPGIVLRFDEDHHAGLRSRSGVGQAVADGARRAGLQRSAGDLARVNGAAQSDYESSTARRADALRRVLV
jgi:hypothetical protein